MADRLLRETKPGPGYLPEIIPGQYWDQTANEGLGGYERVQGSGGAPRVLLWGPDGSALMTAEKPGYVDVTDREGRSLGVVSATNLDIALSVLRDAVTGTGAGAKTQADIVTSLAAILAKVIAAPATEAKQDALNAKDFATAAKQDASKAVLDLLNAKDYATEAKLEAVRLLLASLDGKDYATQTTLAAVATAAKQDTAQTRLNLLSTEATLTAVLAKIIAAPSTEAKQDTQITRLNLLSTEATLEAVRAALVAGGLPATTLETTHQNAASTNIPGVAATVSGYGPIGFQATGVFDGATVTYEGSVDGTNYVALSGSSAVTAVGIFKTDVSGLKNVRAVISNAGASTSLTVKSLAVAVAKPTSANVTAVGAAAHDAAATGNPVQIGGVYRVADPVLADGDAGSLRLNAKGEARVELTGSNAEVVSAQDAQVSAIAQTYIRAVGATQIEVYVESGYVRVRTDGEAATPTTGEPFGPGYGGAWTVNSISVYYVADSTITVVSR